MTLEEALAMITAVLAPRFLSELQIAVFRGAWNKESYLKISRELNHKEGYIKDVGAELWQLLTEALGINVTKLNLQSALLQYVQLRRNQPVLPRCLVDWGEAPEVSQFYGRQTQLDTLNQWVTRDGCRLITIVGMGGIGKTRLVTCFAKLIAEQFEVVLWRSLRQAPPLIDFLTELMQVMAPSKQLPTRLDAMMLTLVKQLRHHRCLLILDNVESVLLSSELVGTYRPGYEDYGWLFQQLGEGQHQSTILLTSREIPTEVATGQGTNVPIKLLRLESMLIDEGETILRAKGLTFQPDQPQVRSLIELYQGNPLALEIVAYPLINLFDSNITAFLAQETLLFKDIRGLLTSQFNRLSSLEVQVMYWLAINREAVTAAQLQADLLPSISLVELRDTLFSLDRRSLIEKIKPTEGKATTLMRLDDVSYTQQPVVMEYVIQQLIEKVCQEVEFGNINCLRTHALLKAQAKDYVRDAQMRLIVQPILAKLLEMQGGSENLKHLLLQLLRIQQYSAPLQPGYFAGNAINLLLVLGVSLSHLDFSYLTIWQADLRMVNLHSTDFSHASLRHSVFTQSTTGILCVAFSPDGKNIATTHDNGEICVWQVDSGQQTAAFRGVVSWAMSVIFSPDGDTLIVSNQARVIKLLHIPSRTVRGELYGHTGGVWRVAITPDGRLLASGGEDLTIKIWDMQTLKCIKTLEGHQGWLGAITFSPDVDSTESYLLASGAGDCVVRLWDIQSGQTLRILEGHEQGILAVTFSPDGQLLATSSTDGTIRLWDANTGQTIAAWSGHNYSTVWTLAFSPDGQTLASGSEDQTIKLWDIKTKQCCRTFSGHTGVVQSIAFSPSGLTLISTTLNQSIRLWDVQTGRCLKTWQGYSKVVYCVIFHPLGGILASCHGDKTLRLWDVQSGHCLNCLIGHTDRISSIAFSPDGQLLASGSFDRTVCLWNVNTGNFLRAFHTPGWVNSVTFSADGTMLASSGIDRVVRVWNVQTGQCLRVIESLVGWVPCVAFSPYEQCLASSNEDGTVKLWDASNYQCLQTLKGHARQAKTLAFDPTANKLASGSDDCTVKLWDLQTGQCLNTLQGHTHPVASISFHPQGNLLVSGSFDTTLKLWDLDNSTLIGTLQGHTNSVHSVTFDPFGCYIASSSEDGTIRLWDSHTGDCLRILTIDRPYEAMNISGVTGITDAQKEMLRILGAIER